MRKMAKMTIILGLMLCACACGTKESSEKVQENDVQSTVDVKYEEEITSVEFEQENVNSETKPMDVIINANIDDNYMQINDMLFVVDGTMSLEEVKEQFDNSTSGLSFSYEYDPFDGKLDIHNPTRFEFEFSSLPDMGILNYSIDDIVNFRNTINELGTEEAQRVLLEDERYNKIVDEPKLVNISYWGRQGEENIQIYYAGGISRDGILPDGTRIDKNKLKQMLDDWGIKAVESNEDILFDSGYGECYIQNLTDNKTLDEVISGNSIYNYRSGSSDIVMVYSKPLGLRLMSYSDYYGDEMHISWWRTVFTFGEDGYLMGVGINDSLIQIAPSDL